MHSTHSVGQANSGGSENLQGAQPPLQQAEHPSQYPNGGNLAISAPAPAQPPAWLQQAAERNPHLTPEVAHAQAEAERVKGLADFARESTKAEETRLKQEEVKLKREMLKKGLGIEDSTNGPRSLVGRTLGTVQMRAIDWLWTGWIPKGYITLLAGETGAGKSTVLADVTARVTTGAPWPGEYEPRQPGRVLWLGSEDSIEEMTAPRLVACGGNLNHVIEIQGVTQQGKRNTFSMQDDLGEIRRWLTAARDEGFPFAMLVIDPVTSYLPGQKLRKVDLNDAGQLRTVLEPWLVLAQEHNIAIVCVTHFAKDTTRSMLHRVLGSAAFTQTCRSLMAIVSREDDGHHAKAMVQVKVNLPEHPGGSWKFSTVKVDIATDPRNGKPISATRPNWEELDSALTPQSMVGNTRGPVSKYEAAFGMWLKAYFLTTPATPWQPISQVKQAAASASVVSERWWNEHSGSYMDKQNVGGIWYCRPKNLYAETT
ncbi:TPA: AAA family ATPase [Pseudomonas aeruginosa]